MKTTLTALLLSITSCILGCALPGSRVGYVSVQGALDDETGTPLRRETVEFILPAAHGLGGLDRYFGKPADYGHKDRRFSVTTDDLGQFRHDLGQTVYHAAMWFIPPLGMLPRRPPAPFFLVRVPRYGGEYYAVETWNGRFKVYSSSGAEVPLSQSKLVSLKAHDTGYESELSGTLGVIQLRVRSADQIGSSGRKVGPSESGAPNPTPEPDTRKSSARGSP